MYKFKPILKSMLWGGEKLIPYKGINSDKKSASVTLSSDGYVAAHSDEKSSFAATYPKLVIPIFSKFLHL